MNLETLIVNNLTIVPHPLAVSSTVSYNKNSIAKNLQHLITTHLFDVICNLLAVMSFFIEFETRVKKENSFVTQLNFQKKFQLVYLKAKRLKKKSDASGSDNTKQRKKRESLTILNSKFSLELSDIFLVIL